MEQLKIAWEWARDFNDEGLHIILFVLALLYIAVRKEEKKKRYLILGYTILVLLTYFCPPVVWLTDKILGELVYWRMLWILPVPVFLAYTMVKVWVQTESKLMRVGIFVIFFALLQLLGQNVYFENSPYTVRSNWEKLPTSPVAIVEIINADRGNSSDWALLAAPEDMVEYIMQYDASVSQVYGRKGVTRSQYIKDSIISDEIVYDRFCSELREIQCNYVVLPNNTEERMESMRAYGFEVIGEVGSYMVYKDTEWEPEM